MRASKGKFIGKSFKIYNPRTSAKKKLEKVQSAELLPYIKDHKLDVKLNDRT